MEDSEMDLLESNNQDENEILVENVRGEIEPSFHEEIRIFIAYITSLSVTLRISMQAITLNMKETLKKFEEFQKENIITQEINGKELNLIKAEFNKEYQELGKQIRALSLAFTTIPRSYVISLISQYDAFLGRIIRIIFLQKPELLNSSEKNLTFSELVEFGSIENAKEFIIEKEIESILRKSHVDQIKWLENKFNIPLKKDLAIWCDFVEITERRNLFVHTGGVVSSQYLKVCKENNVNLEKIKNGKEIGVNQKYFQKAYNVIFEFGFKLAQVLWRITSPNELDKADYNLISIGYDTLSEENYELTKKIFDFGSITLKNHSEEENRLIMIVNRAQAYKWSGDEEKAKKILLSEDWSALKTKFRLAKEVLLDQFDIACELMKEIGTNHNEMQKGFYRDWPLFKKIRVEEKFINTFQEIYGEPFNKIDENVSDLSKNISNNDLQEILNS